MIIDRFEGDFAIIETDDQKYINIEKKHLPNGAKEGDVIIKNSTEKYIVDYKKTSELRAKALEALADLR